LPFQDRGGAIQVGGDPLYETRQFTALHEGARLAIDENVTRTNPISILLAPLFVASLATLTGCTGNLGEAPHDQRSDAGTTMNDPTSIDTDTHDASTSDSAEPQTDAAKQDAAPVITTTTDGGPPVTANTDSEGWTILPGLPGTANGYQRAIYVDSVGGSETNTGASADQALKEISSTSALYKILTSADAKTQAIEILLKPGSSWPADHMMLPIGGTTLFPLLISGSKWPGMVTAKTRPQVGEGIEAKASHVAIEGLEIGPGNGMDPFGIYSSISGGTDLLIEDCLITRFYNLIQILGSHTQSFTNIRIRRNYLFGAFKAGSGSTSSTVAAIVGFDGCDIDGALFEQNFFDYNGGPTGDYDTNSSLTAPYSDYEAHDIYFADDGMAVIALNISFRQNLFARTLQSMKGPYTGVVDDNLYYNYSTGGYVGADGLQFTNNVLMDGGGFLASLDNAHDPNTDPTAKTLVCNNLFNNQQSPYVAAAFGTGTLGNGAVGVNLSFAGNVIDGFDKAFYFDDPSCFGYDFTNNTIQTTSFFEMPDKLPATCPMSASGNTYYSAKGATAAGGGGYALDVNGTYSDFSALETMLAESNGTFASKEIPFADPTRNIGTYLTQANLTNALTATLLDYLALVRSQGSTIHQWNAALGVDAVNTYLRAGHALPGRSLAYNSGCP
jgi:hypothetical protein